MASIIWASRADNSNFSARYSAAGLTGSTANVGAAVTYDTDVTALITGHNVNMDNGTTSVKVLTYGARGVFSNIGISINFRAKFSNATNCALFEIASGPSTPMNYYAMWLSSAGAFRVIIKNQTGQAVANSVIIYTGFPTLDTWFDFTLTWDGTTNANKIIFYIDGVSVGTATASFAATAVKNSQFTDYISLGNIDGLPTTRVKFEEFTIWDYEIDPTAVLLDSGVGALNGVLRSSPVTVSQYDGTAQTSSGSVVERLF